MNIRFLIVLLPLTLGGCVIGDDVAHVVKLVGKNSSNSGSPAAADSAAPAQPASAAPVDADPPPQATPAPTNSIKVEDLPPPKR